MCKDEKTVVILTHNTECGSRRSKEKLMMNI